MTVAASQPTQQVAADEMPVTLAEPLREKHWHFVANAFDNVYVVGDVHGCFDELQTLWQRLNPSDSELVVFVGDLVRKGPASIETVEFVAEQENAVSVQGNNEAKIINDRINSDPFEPITDVLDSFPLVVSWDGAVVLHGGINPQKPVTEHTSRELVETRAIPPENGYDGPFWFELYDEDPRIFFGHTVLRDPFISESAVGLDTGCVYGGKLTAYDCANDELISVPAERTYQSRPDSKFLDFS